MGVFNPLAKRYQEQNLEKCYEINEKEKKKHYNERIQNVGHGKFISFFFECQWRFLKRTQTFLRKTIRENSGKKR